MLTIRLTATVRKHIEASCRESRAHETGGMLFGEHVAENDFRVVEVTTSAPGAVACFTRGVEPALSRLDQFFQATDHAYTRFNYLGEWHSHPLFALEPSDVDDRTMYGIVTDPEIGAHFAVSLIVRLEHHRLAARAWVYFPDGGRFECNIISEHEEPDREPSDVR